MSSVVVGLTTSRDCIFQSNHALSLCSSPSSFSLPLSSLVNCGWVKEEKKSSMWCRKGERQLPRGKPNKRISAFGCVAK